MVNQHPVAIDYETVHIEEAFKADLIVENLVIVELKSVEAIAPIHKKQLLTYLRLAHAWVSCSISTLTTSEMESLASSTTWNRYTLHSFSSFFFASLRYFFASLRETL